MSNNITFNSAIAAIVTQDRLISQQGARLIAEATNLLPPLVDIVSGYTDDPNTNLNARLTSPHMAYLRERGSPNRDHWSWRDYRVQEQGVMQETDVREALETQGEWISGVALDILARHLGFPILVANSGQRHRVSKEKIAEVIRHLGQESARDPFSGNQAELLALLNSRLIAETQLKNESLKSAYKDALAALNGIFWASHSMAWVDDEDMYNAAYGNITACKEKLERLLNPNNCIIQ